MNPKILLSVMIILFCPRIIYAQETDPFIPDFKNPEEIPGMKLVWNDEFNNIGKPESVNWIYENGFVRNQELQWYQPENANCANGLLIIEGKHEKVKTRILIPEVQTGNQDVNMLSILQPAFRPAD